jgi:succinoglycan biosynthesis transport protein ExoP
MERQESSSSIGKYWQMLQRRWLPSLCVSSSVFGTVFLTFSLINPVYLAEGKLRFQRNNTTSALTGLGTEISRLDPIIEQGNPLSTEAEVIRSFPVIQKVINNLQLKDKKGKSLKVKDFLKKLSVKEIRGADVIQISYTHTSPVTSAKVVNELIRIYLEQNVSSLRSQAAAARKFIENQLPNAEQLVRKAESELANFKVTNNVVSLQEEANRGVEVIANLQIRINEAQAQLADAQAQSQKIYQQLGVNSQQALSRTALSQNVGVQDTLKEIQRLEIQLADRKAVLQANHPQIQILTDKINYLRAVLKTRINQAGEPNPNAVNTNLQLGELQQQLSARLVQLESNRAGLASQVATLFRAHTTYKQRLNALPVLEEQQRQLERKLQAAQSTYLLLLQKLQESRIAENQNLGNASIISLAQIPELPNNSPLLSYLSAGLLSFVAGLVTIYLLEAKDKSIKTVDEAQALLGLTLLGILPSFSQGKKYPHQSEEINSDQHRVVIRDFPRSPISEGYRMLRANLKFMSADKELKVIVVTSAVPREGKSTVAANLATAMAQMEHKVLLIDGDLYRPVQNKIWNLTNSPGLSNLIVGEIDTKAVIKKVMNNLDVLTSGVVPPSSASLLDSQRMADLINKFAAQYDFVIIDTPALNVAADAATLGQMADGVLFVVRPGVVDSVSAGFAKEMLEKSGQNVLGQVVNGVILNNEPYSYYYFTREENPPATSQQSPKTLISTNSQK